MDNNKLIKQWSVDSAIDATDLSGELARIYQLHCNYMDKWDNCKAEIEALERELAILVAQKYRFFIQGASKETKAAGWEHPTNAKILKQDVPIYQAADKHIQDLEKKLGKSRRDLKILEWIMKAVEGRQFVLNKMIDYEKWKGGG